jgi:hypothetical protein
MVSIATGCQTMVDFFCFNRNIFDWVSIILLLVCIGTHIDDIVAHTENKARNHIRVMAVTVILISVRLLKSARVIIPKFGTLVMILYYSIADMIIWFILYLVIWLSFSKSGWVPLKVF